LIRPNHSVKDSLQLFTPHAGENDHGPNVGLVHLKDPPRRHGVSATLGFVDMVVHIDYVKLRSIYVVGGGMQPRNRVKVFQ
jgi:hypothetical protein